MVVQIVLAMIINKMTVKMKHKVKVKREVTVMDGKKETEHLLLNLVWL